MVNDWADRVMSVADALLEERLPKTTLVSIGHRSALNAFHRRRMSIERDGERHRVRQTGTEPAR